MKNIFVFPCGSEIALEVAKSLSYDFHFHLIGGASVKDHGRFVFSDIIEDLPWENDEDFLPRLREIVQKRSIDIIYPAMDSTIVKLKTAEEYLGCKVIGANLQTTQICLSKRKTYDLLRSVIKVPQIYSKKEATDFPFFVKPDIGYGARRTRKINTAEELQAYPLNTEKELLCEYLPGDEYTVDCFTDRHGKLRFYAPRIRGRIQNGVSVHTAPVSEPAEFAEIAEKINQLLTFRGAWFFQVKRDKNGILTLLEIAARFGGSSSLQRAKNVNLAQLTLWDMLDADITITENNIDIEMDRALDNRFKLNISYDEVFLDFDDTVTYCKTRYNPNTMAFIFQCKNRGIKITLLSKHLGSLTEELKKLKIYGLFDRIIHIERDDEKYRYIDNSHAIFVDDSFSEREKISKHCHIPVFGLDMIASLTER